MDSKHTDLDDELSAALYELYDRTELTAKQKRTRVEHAHAALKPHYAASRVKNYSELEPREAIRRVNRLVEKAYTLPQNKWLPTEEAMDQEDMAKLGVDFSDLPPLEAAPFGTNEDNEAEPESKSPEFLRRPPKVKVSSPIRLDDEMDEKNNPYYPYAPPSPAEATSRQVSATRTSTSNESPINIFGDYDNLNDALYFGRVDENKSPLPDPIEDADDFPSGQGDWTHERNDPTPDPIEEYGSPSPDPLEQGILTQVTQRKSKKRSPEVPAAEQEEKTRSEESIRIAALPVAMDDGEEVKADTSVPSSSPPVRISTPDAATLFHAVSGMSAAGIDVSKLLETINSSPDMRKLIIKLFNGSYAHECPMDEITALVSHLHDYDIRFDGQFPTRPLDAVRSLLGANGSTLISLTSNNAVTTYAIAIFDLLFLSDFVLLKSIVKEFMTRMYVAHSSDLGLEEALGLTVAFPLPSAAARMMCSVMGLDDNKMPWCDGHPKMASSRLYRLFQGNTFIGDQIPDKWAIDVMSCGCYANRNDLIHVDDVTDEMVESMKTLLGFKRDNTRIRNYIKLLVLMLRNIRTDTEHTSRARWYTLQATIALLRQWYRRMV